MGPGPDPCSEKTLTTTPSNPRIEPHIHDLIDVISRIYARGWCDGTGGNYSKVLGHDPLELLITRSGVDKGRIGPQDFLVVDSDLNPTEDGGTGVPSAEAHVHVAIAAATGAAAILHTHSIVGTLLSEHFLDRRGFAITGYEMQKGLAGVTSHREQVWVPVIKNSQDARSLADSTDRVISRSGVRGFLIAGHGLYTWGASLDEAYRHVEIFEFLFQVVGHRVSWDTIH